MAGCSAKSSGTDAFASGGGAFGSVGSSGTGSGQGSSTASSGAGGGSANSPSLAPDGRRIQEADIYKLVGNTLYILNASYKGLQLVDVSNPLKPALAATVKVTGSPRQIYVEGNTAYVLLSGAFDYDCGGFKGICGWEAQSGVSTLVLALDVTNPASPEVLGQLTLDGDLQESRIVGNILYVISDTDNLTYVASLDVSKPGSFAKIAQLDFPFDQWDVGVFANVTGTRIIIAGAGDECDATNSAPGCSEDKSVTQFTPIDIADPKGQLAKGTPYVGDGIVMDRWAMDFNPASGLFRAVLSSDSPHVNTGGGLLTSWSAPTIEQATQLSSVKFIAGDNITAAAFSGSRAYVSSALQVSGCPAPLVIFDTSNPAQPTQLGSVTVPGAVDFLYPLGEQLISLGHADANCVAFQGSGQLAVSLFDVSGAQPSLLSQVSFGGQSAAVAASHNDLKKVFLVLQQMGLILVPYQNAADAMDPGGTQLIDLGGGSLTLRGMAPQTGLVERAFPMQEQPVQKELGAFSDQSFQVIDITNRDKPTTVGQLGLL